MSFRYLVGRAPPFYFGGNDDQYRANAQGRPKYGIYRMMRSFMVVARIFLVSRQITGVFLLSYPHRSPDRKSSVQVGPGQLGSCTYISAGGTETYWHLCTQNATARRPRTAEPDVAKLGIEMKVKPRMSDSLFYNYEIKRSARARTCFRIRTATSTVAFILSITFCYIIIIVLLQLYEYTESFNVTQLLCTALCNCNPMMSSYMQFLLP